jgi:ATP/ADP translocase
MAGSRSSFPSNIPSRARRGRHSSSWSPRVDKYGKTVVDTVVARAGDALTAVVVLAGTRAAISTQAFAALNLVLICIWIAAVFAIRHENARRRGASEDLIAAESLRSS